MSFSSPLNNAAARAGMLLVSVEPSFSSTVVGGRRQGLVATPYPSQADTEVYMQAVEACAAERQQDAQGNIYVELWMVKKPLQPQPTVIQGQTIPTAQFDRRAWNKTISIPLTNVGQDRKVFVKVVEKDIAELQQLQAQQQRGMVDNNTYFNMVDNMLPPYQSLLQQQIRGRNAYVKLLDTTSNTVDGKIYVRAPPSEIMNIPTGEAYRNPVRPVFFKPLEPSMVTPGSGISQGNVFFKVFDSDPNANKTYVQVPMEQQQQQPELIGTEQVTYNVIDKALTDVELQQPRQNVGVLNREVLVDASANMQQQQQQATIAQVVQPLTSQTTTQLVQEQPELIGTKPVTYKVVDKTLTDADLQQLRQNVSVLNREVLVDASANMPQEQRQATIAQIVQPVTSQTTTQLVQEQQPAYELGYQPVQIKQDNPIIFRQQQQQQQYPEQLRLMRPNEQWSTIPTGQAYVSELGNFRLKIAVDPAQMLNQQQQQVFQQQKFVGQQNAGEWITVTPRSRQGPMFLNITLENPLRSRL